MDFEIANNSHFLFCYHLAKELFASLPDGRFFLQTQVSGDIVRATARFASDRDDLTVSQSASIKREFGLSRAENLAVGKAAWELFTNLSDRRPPYGVLVGVRPTKVALYYLEHGLSDPELIDRLTHDYFVRKEKALLLLKLAKTEKRIVENLASSDAVLYLSIPFCPSRCKYCSFISQSAPKQLARLDEYLSRMREELQKTAELFFGIGKTLKAVYLGGGTPGVLTEAQLDALFCELEADFNLSPDTEITAELGRPDTVTAEKLRVLSDHGIRRVCINPQTLSDEVLRENGRSHTAKQFYDAYSLARKTGRFCINADLIAGLSGDTPQGFLKSLTEILALDPENLTIHSLCKKRASEDESAFLAASEGIWTGAVSDAMHACINRGYEPYYLYRQKNTIENLENLGYAKPGQECVYNIAMMEDLCDVFSVGAGAITKLISKKGPHQKIRRFASYKYPTEYLSDPGKREKRFMEIKRLYMENPDDPVVL